MTPRRTLTPVGNKHSLPKDMDRECVALCEALNYLAGIRTIESCCGHGEHPFRVWFKTENLEALPEALYYFDRCHSGVPGWSVHATTDCGMSPVTFMVEGPLGDYDGANTIARAMISNDIEP